MCKADALQLLPPLLFLIIIITYIILYILCFGAILSIYSWFCTQGSLLVICVELYVVSGLNQGHLHTRPNLTSLLPKFNKLSDNTKSKIIGFKFSQSNFYLWNSSCTCGHDIHVLRLPYAWKSLAMQGSQSRTARSELGACNSSGSNSAFVCKANSLPGFLKLLLETPFT